MSPPAHYALVVYCANQSCSLSADRLNLLVCVVIGIIQQKEHISQQLN